jgi:hypothetical protein
MLFILALIANYGAASILASVWSVIITDDHCLVCHGILARAVNPLEHRGDNKFPHVSARGNATTCRCMGHFSP